MTDHRPCQVVQYSDLTRCESCGLEWYTNDASPPACGHGGEVLIWDLRGKRGEGLAWHNHRPLIPVRLGASGLPRSLRGPWVWLRRVERALVIDPVTLNAAAAYRYPDPVAAHRRIMEFLFGRFDRRYEDEQREREWAAYGRRAPAATLGQPPEWREAVPGAQREPPEG